MNPRKPRFSGTLTSPYPGLRPFKQHEWPLFFGREEHVAEMLTVLEDRRFLAVIGPSGGGKSSLVFAGLLPALDRGELLTEQSDDWRFVTMRPGDSPFRRLAEALQGQLNQRNDPNPPSSPDSTSHGFHDGNVGFTEALLRSGPNGLINTVKDAQVPAEANVLIVVDQFEEIFRFHQAADAGKRPTSSNCCWRPVETRSVPCMYC